MSQNHEVARQDNVQREMIRGEKRGKRGLMAWAGAEVSLANDSSSKQASERVVVRMQI